MGEFVGKRVVPDHVGVWDQKKTYEPLMIVLDGETGDSYISRKAVPVGVSLADESYWSLCAHYSAQMRKLEQDVDVDVQQMHSDVTAVKNAMSQEFQETHTAISKELDDTHKAISQELSETEQRVSENLEQTSSELTGKVEQAKSDLNTGRQELKDTKDTLNKRMDSIAGGKTSDVEILDARVDADGNTHENLGAHIRSGFESARADQEEAVNHIGRMAAVSDAMRTANMVHTVDFSASNTSGDVKATAVSLGHGDRAGVIINGALKEGENDVSVLRFTEPMAFKAGTPYTVFIDETTPKVGYGIYFYEVGTGNCLQVGGINRGFTPANTKIATAVFDNGGMFRAGIYSTNCEFENHELHLYVVEGEYTQRDFFGLSTVADVSGNVAEIASVRDEVRKNNLIVMKQVILKNEENEPLWTSTPVGALNLGATVLNGQLGPTAGTYAVQISSPFMLDKEKDYTLFLLDERKDLEYSVYLLDETTWKDVMENGATRAFNVIHSPCGLIPAHQTGKHQLRIWVQQDTVFDNRAIQVYLVEGRYSESELRTYLPAKEASAATKGLIGNLNALNRISDPLRRNNMIRTIDFQASASDGQVCATAVSSGVASGAVINGSLGPKQGRNTLYFGESIWLDRTKKYTLYVRSDESMPSCEVYLYGNSKSGCMQVDGLNKGFKTYQRDMDGTIVSEQYFDTEGNPARSLLGQYGELYQRNEQGYIGQITYLGADGKPTPTNAGYAILKRTYHRDGTADTDMYFDVEGNPKALSKGQYGIKRSGDVNLLLDKNGNIMLCVDNLLNGFPCMVVVLGCVVCLLMIVLPKSLSVVLTSVYAAFILYETLMFRESGDARTNLVLFSYAGKFLKEQSVRVGVVNNIWLFIPLGTGLYRGIQKKWVLLIPFVMSVAIETTQYITGLGIAEFDDVFGNTMGGWIGVLVAYIIMMWRSEKVSHRPQSYSIL